MYAYILIGLDEPSEREVLEELSNYSEVVEGHLLFGEWDIILKINVKSSEEVTSFLIDRVRHIKSVRLTSTLMVAE